MSTVEFCVYSSFVVWDFTRMDNEKQPPTAIQPLQPVAVRGQNVEVTATGPDEMAIAQSALIEWTRWKIGQCVTEETEMHDAWQLAVKNKWRTVTLKAHAERAAKRTVFYRKILAALEAGYHIVPNFPVEMFAIRTNRKNPSRKYGFSAYKSRNMPAGELPQGEGEYRNPEPKEFERTLTVQEHGKDVQRTSYWAEGWKEMEFPVTMSKPQIMEATTRAMALNLFDEFGILPANRRKGDPMIVATIRRPNLNRWQHSNNEGAVTFLICWHLSSADL